MKTRPFRILTAMTLPMLVLMSVASGIGFLNEDTYIRELPSFAAQGAGQDFVNLFIAGPIMLFSLIMMRRDSKTASWVFAGTDLYFMYSYIIYVFGLHYNGLFLAYCLVLALSTYILIFWIHFESGRDIPGWFRKMPPLRFTGGFILFMAALFYMLWLKDLIPPLLQGEAPDQVAENSYLINPVHAIDLSFMLPALLIVAILLFRKHPLGMLFAPVILVFIMVLTIALAAMIIVVTSRGIDESTALVWVFLALTLAAGFILARFLLNLARTDQRVSVGRLS